MKTGAQRRIKRNIKVDANGCWLWQRRLNISGYGQMGVGSRTDGTRRTAIAHRISYEIFVGTIAEGMQIDHLCKVRSCVNPEHLEQVTPSVNVRRSNGSWAQLAARTHCPQGHEYVESNIYRRKENNSRACRACDRQRCKERYWRKKTAMVAVGGY